MIILSDYFANFDDILVIVKLSPSQSNSISIDQTKIAITAHQPTHSPTPTQEGLVLIQGKLEHEPYIFFGGGGGKSIFDHFQPF